MKPGESWDPIWEDVFKAHAWGQYPSENFIRFMARYFYKRERASVKVLEVGCGPGANIWYLAREGFSTSGIDGSRTAIQRAMDRLKREGLSARLEVGDIVRLPFSDGVFDAVADNECLTHNRADAVPGILSEIHRVLVPGGLFYSQTFTDEMYVGKTQREVGPRQFLESSDGSFAGRGFVRLTNTEDIKKFYGARFDVLTLDRMDYTVNDRASKVSEWAIVCEKK